MAVAMDLFPEVLEEGRDARAVRVSRGTRVQVPPRAALQVLELQIARVGKRDLVTRQDLQQRHIVSAAWRCDEDRGTVVSVAS